MLRLALKRALQLKFTDVNEDDWYYSYVLVAVEEGYIKGFHDNTFRGEDPVTREQACAIINRVTAAKGITLFDIPLTEQITDEISDWAVEDVKKIVANFVMPVEEGGKFRATQDITRAELVLSLDMFVAQPVKEYTVTFETNGGSAIESVKVAEGNKISKPADPKKANYTFSGWYSDKTLKIAYDFSAEVAADITLYAKWTSASGGGGGGGGGGSNTPTQYTVTFETNGGSTIASVKVTAGSMFAKPKDPTKSDCYFAGWYKDAAFKNAYAFNESVNGNITIYAKWYTKAERLADLKILKNVLDATEVEETAHQEAMAIILDTFVKVIAGGEAGAYIDEAYITSNFTSNINSLKSKWNAMDEDTKDNLEFILLEALDDAHKAGFSMKSSEVYSLFNSIAGDILG